MSIKGIFRSVFGTILISLVLLAFLAVSLAHRQEELNSTQIRRVEALRLVQEMRDSRDYLMQFARGYVLSGNERYFELYESLAGIWDGKRPRPVYLDETYWDVLADGGNTRVRLRPAISFATLVEDAGFSREEQIRINEILRLSLEMTQLEAVAFRDYTRSKDPTAEIKNQTVDRPIEYLTGDRYNQIRLNLKQNYARIFSAINDRANSEINAIGTRNWYLLYSILGIMLALTIVVLGAYRMILARVIVPISYLKDQTNALEKDFDRLVQATRSIASGALDAKFSPKTLPIDFPNEDEIGQLVRIHNGMLNHMKDSGSLIANVALDLRKSHEEAASADRAKSEFLANMTHEIRTPMNAIVGFSELLITRVQDPILRNYTEGIRVGSKNLLQLINDILDLSKIEAGYLEIKSAPFQLTALQRELLQMFSEEAKQKGVNLSFSKGLEDIRVLLDESRLRQVLINLIGNALKFTSQGFVHVEFRLCRSSDAERGDLLIRVQDTGIGIAQSDFEKIFQAFSQAEGQSNRKYAGTGLGLTISRRLVELMGGRIDVDSVRGQGSCFSLAFSNLLLKSHAPMPLELNEPKERAVFYPSTIVIGEDVESNLELLTAYLEPHPFKIYSASDGQSVLDLVQRHNPDLLLLDLQMPVIDGKEVLKILRNDPHYKELSIVVLTASSPYENSTGWEQYCSAIIRKPLRGSELFRELRKFLNFHMEKIDDRVEQERNAWPLLGDDSQLQLQALLEQSETQLHGGMDLDHIETVSRKVYEIAQKETHAPLETCAAGLLEAIEDFNMLRIKVIFDEIKFHTKLVPVS